MKPTGDEGDMVMGNGLMMKPEPDDNWSGSGGVMV